MVDLNDSIRQIAARLGSGNVSPSAYDTAWVARIPSLADATKPAYPAALAWLRAKQLPSGEWDHAPERPWIQGTVFATLAAVSALAEWKDPGDAPRIARAVARLEALVPDLAAEPPGTSVTALLLFANAREAVALGVAVPDGVYRPYEERAKKVLGYLEHLIRENDLLRKPHPGWFNLEMMGSLMSPERLAVATAMRSDNGSVAASPSASAFLLREHRRLGRDLPDVAAYLDALVDSGRGGVRHFGLLDQMDLVIGLNFLVRGGIPANSPLLAPAVELLAQRFDRQRGISWGRGFPCRDSDDSAMAAEVLLRAGKPTNIEVVREFFNGSYFTCYREEASPTPAVSMNVVAALEQFEISPELEAMKQKTVTWLTSQIREDGYILDRWHLSPFYAEFRAVFALRDLAPEAARRCVGWMLREEHASGGWGMLGLATAEETAYAVLALRHWRERHPSDVDAEVFARAQTFLERETARPAMWPCSKALFLAHDMVEAVIVAARHALRGGEAA
jgi:halimadienyl-diphosphate synthase